MKRSSVIYYIAILLFVVAAYWQVSLMVHPLLWDARDGYFTWRYFMGECLQNGRLPVWDPYQHGGYPFFADPQSGAFYAVPMLIGLLARYSIFVFQFEFILTIFIAGVGMYQLLKAFSCTPKAALFGALCFVACGFFVGIAELLTWVVSAAWITWLLWAYRRLLQSLKYGYALLCAVFLSLMLSGGYPAYLIIACYLMGALFVWVLISEKARHKRILIVKVHALFAFTFLLLAGVCIVSFAEASHFITRGAGVTLSKANSNPFSPQSSLSFLLPFSTLKNAERYQNDITMRNAYFGIVALALTLTGLSMPKSRKHRVVIIISVLCLFISFGPFLPLRGWLYEYVPLMNVFRFPSMFRLFFIIGFIVLAATTFQQVGENEVKYRARLKGVVILLIAVLVALGGYEVRKYGMSGNYAIILTSLDLFIRQSLFFQHVIIQSVIQLAILLLFLFMIQFRKGRYLTPGNILLLCVFDLFCATQLNVYGTVVGPETCREINARTSSQVRGFPMPDAHRAMNANDDASMQQMRPLTGNLNNFTKRLGTGGYNPFLLSNFDSLYESSIRDSVWANPYIYLSYEVAPVKSGDRLAQRNVAAVADVVYCTVKDMALRRGDSDRVDVTAFAPGKVVATTHTTGTVILVLQQSYYPGWKVLVDNKPVQFFVSAYANISLVLPRGKHQVVFSFRPRYLMPLTVVSFGSLMVIIVCLITFRKKLF